MCKTLSAACFSRSKIIIFCKVNIAWKWKDLGQISSFLHLVQRPFDAFPGVTSHMEWLIKVMF